MNAVIDNFLAEVASLAAAPDKVLSGMEQNLHYLAAEDDALAIEINDGLLRIIGNKRLELKDRIRSVADAFSRFQIARYPDLPLAGAIDVYALGALA